MKCVRPDPLPGSKIDELGSVHEHSPNEQGVLYLALTMDLGHEVEEAIPRVDMEALNTATKVIVSANTALMVKQREYALGRTATEQEIKPVNRILMALSEL